MPHPINLIKDKIEYTNIYWGEKSQLYCIVSVKKQGKDFWSIHKRGNKIIMKKIKRYISLKKRIESKARIEGFSSLSEMEKGGVHWEDIFRYRDANKHGSMAITHLVLCLTKIKGNEENVK